jgi:hypothetical protein
MSRFSSSLVALIACTPSRLTAQTPERGPTTLTARVFDQAGAPLPGAGITFGSQAELLTTDALEGAAARSGADGRLELRVHLPQTVDYGGSSPPTVLIAAKGKVALAMSPHEALRTAQPPATLDLGDFVLFDAITLRGRVVDAADQPLAGARVAATDALRGQCDHTLTGMMPHGRSAVLTDAKGIFALPCVPDGGVVLIASKPGHYSRCLPLVGSETPLTIALRASGYLRGRALDAHGNGIATTLSLLSECGPSGAVRSAADGTFTRDRDLARTAAPAQLPGGRRRGPEPPQRRAHRSAGRHRAASGRRADGVRVRVRAVDAASGNELEDFPRLRRLGRSRAGGAE